MAKNVSQNMGVCSLLGQTSMSRIWIKLTLFVDYYWTTHSLQFIAVYSPISAQKPNLWQQILQNNGHISVRVFRLNNFTQNDWRPYLKTFFIILPNFVCFLIKIPSFLKLRRNSKNFNGRNLKRLGGVPICWVVWTKNANWDMTDLDYFLDLN